MRSPAGLVWVETEPNTGSAASSLFRRPTAACVCDELAAPSTTIWIGLTRPAENFWLTMPNACFDSKLFGRLETPETPVFMVTSGEAASSSTPTPTAMARPGRRIARCATRASHDDLPWERPSMSRLPRYGTLRRLTRGPSRPRTAGSRVSAANTAEATTRIAPAARLTKMLVGTMSMPSSASTTVMPLKKTARPAVPPATATASGTERPCASSSRKRDTMNSE